MKKINVHLTGLPPGLLFQSKGVMEADSGKPKAPIRTPEEEADLRAHWTSKGKDKQLCLPWVMLYQSLCTAAGTFKYRGTKKFTTVIAATVTCQADKISLGTNKYEVYTDWVRIPPRTGAMVRIGRPLLREWEVNFVLLVDDENGGYAAANIQPILEYAGNLVGIGAWRPQLRGAYGRFAVTKFNAEN